MANTVFKVVTIELLNGKEYNFRPLSIKRLRRFMKELQDQETGTDGLDSLLDLTAICIESVDVDLANDKEALEDVVDPETAYKIIDVCTGIKFNDPNLVQAILEEAASQETAGQTST